jgi:hypothetical protein
MAKKPISWFTTIAESLANLGSIIYQDTAKKQADKDKATEVTAIVEGVLQTGGEIGDQLESHPDTPPKP